MKRMYSDEEVEAIIEEYLKLHPQGKKLYKHTFVFVTSAGTFDAVSISSKSDAFSSVSDVTKSVVTSGSSGDYALIDVLPNGNAKYIDSGMGAITQSPISSIMMDSVDEV